MIVYLFTVIFIIGHNNVVLASLSQDDALKSDPFISWDIDNTINPKMPEATYEIFVGYHSSRNRIWIVAGLKRMKASWYFDLNTNSWTAGIMSYEMQDYSSMHTQINDYIYFVDNNKLHQFDMNTGDITGRSEPLPTNVVDGCLANDNRYIFIIGGHGTLQIYDTLTEKWLPAGNPLNEGRSFLTCNISPNGQYLYAFGGGYSGEYLSSMEKIDISNMANIESSEWEILPDLIKSNQAYSQSVVDPIHNLIYIIGGADDTADSVLIFDPETDSSDTSAVTLNIGRFLPGVIMINNNIIYVFGGLNKDCDHSGCDTMDPLDTFEISNMLHTSTPTAVPTPAPTNNPTYK